MSRIPDDPRFTAWMLGELSGRELAEVEELISRHPEWMAELEERRALQSMMEDALAIGGRALRPAQIARIRTAGRQPVPQREIRVAVKRAWGWVVPTAAAALVCLGLYGIARLPMSGNGTQVQAGNGQPDAEPETGRVVYLPLPGPGGQGVSGVSVARGRSEVPHKLRDMQADALREDPAAFLRSIDRTVRGAPAPELAELPPLERRGFIDTGMESGMDLPLLAGRSSFHWVSSYVRDRGMLPPGPSVRLEEIVNGASPGIAGVSKTADGVTFTAETLACRWRPSTWITAIGIRGAKDGSRDVDARLQLSKSAVSRYRLLGFDPIRGAGENRLPRSLPKLASTVVLVEVQPAGKPLHFGRIGMSVGKQEKALASMDLPTPADGVGSPGAALAMLMAGFSEWLEGAEGAPDLVQLEGLLRDAKQRNPEAVGDQKEAMVLVEDTMALARSGRVAPRK